MVALPVCGRQVALHASIQTCVVRASPLQLSAGALVGLWFHWFHGSCDGSCDGILHIHGAFVSRVCFRATNQHAHTFVLSWAWIVTARPETRTQ